MSERFSETPGLVWIDDQAGMYQLHRGGAAPRIDWRDRRHTIRWALDYIGGLRMARGDENDPRHTTEMPRGDEPVDAEEREEFERTREAADKAQDTGDVRKSAQRGASPNAGEPRKDV